MGETKIIHLSRLIALERRLDNVANNVANADTTGFRDRQLSFQEYLINLDRVEYRELRTREIRWSICSSIRKQTIRFWIIGLQFSHGLLAQHPAATFVLFR
jgi:flagellar basal body rod protein FlgG